MSHASPSFHFVGGKGGVGKTTCAAALAIAAATRGRRVLVASTDPAPSLADAFDVRLSARPRRVASTLPRLFAAEIDAATSFRRWIDERRALLETIAVEGTWLDEDDVSRLLRLSLPGIDELAALFEIAGLSRGERFDDVIVDTAPTGHTLRMLALPDTLADVAGLFDTMRDRQRTVEAALRGRSVRRPEDHLIGELAGTATALHALLRDAARTQVSWVTLPEPVAVAEANDAVSALESSGIAVRQFIINRITPQPRTQCPHCESRRTFERESLRALQGTRTTVAVTARDTEPRGLRALQSIAREVVGASVRMTASAARRTWRATLPGLPSPPSELAGHDTRLLLVVGKGGVGKSTTAAAIALALADQAPERAIVLISTDPAHSLRDVLGADAKVTGGAIAGLPSNLTVHELDASASLAGLRSSYGRAIDGVFDRLSSGSRFDVAHDRLVLKRLLDLAPPGLDELAAVLEVSALTRTDDESRELIIMDTAPTGHALRLLEMPALVHDWVRTLMSILLKYQDVTGLGAIGALLLDLSRRIGGLRQLLTDPHRTRAVVVTRAAALPRLESTRLLRRLQRMQIATAGVLVNVLGRGSCSRCRKESIAQRHELEAIGAALPARRRPVLIGAPTHVPAPVGRKALLRWADAWTRLE